MVLSRPYRTPLQRRLEDRNLVIFAAHEFGCPVRLIARALGLDPARVRQVPRRVGARQKLPGGRFFVIVAHVDVAAIARRGKLPVARLRSYDGRAGRPTPNSIDPWSRERPRTCTRRGLR